MIKIERGKTVVTLYPRIQSDLDDRMEQMLAEVRKERSSGPRRSGEKSKANDLADEYEAKVAEAETAGVKVTLHEISTMEWQNIADEHPPREGDPRDAKLGWNAKTFIPALLRASIGNTDLDLDSLSIAHVAKLNEAVWNLHNADDALPKDAPSLLLQEYREAVSRLQPDSA